MIHNSTINNYNQHLININFSVKFHYLIVPNYKESENLPLEDMDVVRFICIHIPHIYSVFSLCSFDCLLEKKFQSGTFMLIVDQKKSRSGKSLPTNP